MITTSTIINITKVLRAGEVSTHSTSSCSIFVKHSGETRRFNATSVVNTTTIASGSILFSDIATWGDGSYSFYITAESNSDQDTNGITYTKIGTGYFRKITNSNVITI